MEKKEKEEKKLFCLPENFFAGYNLHVKNIPAIKTAFILKTLQM